MAQRRQLHRGSVRSAHMFPGFLWAVCAQERRCRRRRRRRRRRRIQKVNPMSAVPPRRTGTSQPAQRWEPHVWPPSIITIHRTLARMGAEETNSPAAAPSPPVAAADNTPLVHGAACVRNAVSLPSASAPDHCPTAVHHCSIPPGSDLGFGSAARAPRTANPRHAASTRRCQRAHCPRLGPSARCQVRSGASSHLYRWLLLWWPFNQVCFLRPASPPRCHWRRGEGESRFGALSLDDRPVNQRLKAARPPGAFDEWAGSVLTAGCPPTPSTHPHTHLGSWDLRSSNIMRPILTGWLLLHCFFS